MFSSRTSHEGFSKIYYENLKGRVWRDMFGKRLVTGTPSGTR